MIQTGSNDVTHWFEDGVEVYPCRCGETHRGDYALYDWGHHNCLHEGRLFLSEQVLEGALVICMECGLQWLAEAA